MFICSSRPMAGRRSEAQSFRIEHSDFNLAEEDVVKAIFHFFEAQFFKAKDLADKDSTLVPTDIVTVVDTPRDESVWINIFRYISL